MHYPESVDIVEAGPRDGLQSLPRMYSTQQKVDMIVELMDAGLKKIEATAFVRPDVIPQLSDAEAVLAAVPRRPDCVLRALVPNRRGTERALAAGADELLGLITASESYNRKNQGMSIDDNLRELEHVASLAQDAGVPVVVAIGLAMFCPYDGEIPPDRVVGIIERLKASGLDAYYIATSVGVDGPRRTSELCGRLLDAWPDLELAVHLHDTNGMALANALAAMDAGVRVFEGSICGIGGGIRMPTGMPRCGNVATEDLVHLFYESGVETDLDLDKVVRASQAIADLLDLEETGGIASRGATKAAVRHAAALDTAGTQH
jgi:hydroxymethylglutaryl-CoA lyase